MTDPAAAAHPSLKLAVITGLSGAGRSTAAKCLEDLGWFVVDNLPPALIPDVADLAAKSGGGVDRVGVVVDVRSRGFNSDLSAALAGVREGGFDPRIVFLEAPDEVLVRRFDGVRRPHPLQGGGRVLEGIAEERELLHEVRGVADVVLDTSALNVHELRAKIAAVFDESGANELHVSMVTFGYKYGLPVDADVVIDCRLLPNPHWVPELKPLSGQDPAVRDYIFGQPGAAEFVDDATRLLRRYELGYVNEGKQYATIAIGCTGGRHRSVAIAEELTNRLRGDGVDVTLSHRDKDRE
ncbi:MAG TPA: RNase adapter RapZ [Mycobacteriales bacterium]|nr:RNase adapter RapZ [Mycobacteriales bacterium]HWA68174.1 RNase adapter RapZ [Mycobacteriales bacterium]